MNHDSVNEYISWLEKFGEIYEEYIISNKEIEKIYRDALIKFKNILKINKKNGTEEDIIRSLKELVYKCSIIYDANESKNKSKKGPRNTDAFKQNIYETEIAKLKEWLIANINNTELFPNFESIVMYVAKKRQMIEFLKLTKVYTANYKNHSSEIEKYIYFEQFGKIRRVDLFSLFNPSHATHFILSNWNKSPERQIKYNTFNLTIDRQLLWKHTNHLLFPQLFKIMNELYTEFLSLVNGHNNTSKRDILPELYWLYMQTCPFERGSAAIGEILFSVLLRKHFGCDFLISNGWNGDPLTIPDIHALHYELDHFKSIFWDQFTNCKIRPNPNINNAMANQLRR